MIDKLTSQNLAFGFCRIVNSSIQDRKTQNIILAPNSALHSNLDVNAYQHLRKQTKKS